MNWKILAIVFITLFILETLFFTSSIIYVAIEETRQRECFWDFCNGFPDAEYYNSVCYCYDYDLLGSLTLNKTKIIN